MRRPALRPSSRRRTRVPNFPAWIAEDFSPAEQVLLGEIYDKVKALGYKRSCKLSAEEIATVVSAQKRVLDRRS